MDRFGREIKVAHDNLERLRERSITKLDDDAALEHIATLIDASDDACFARGADARSTRSVGIIFTEHIGS